MRTSVEPLDGNKVKVSVEVDEDEFGRAIDAAFRRIAQHVRIPGFRPGKAPRQLLESRVGAGAAREEALRDALPDYFEQAVKEHDLDPVAPPEIDLTAGREEGPVQFDAVVEVMPTLSLDGYESLKVVLPIEAVTEQDVEGQLTRLREQFGELRTVSRPARDGDNVLVDRKVYRHDTTLVAASDELFEGGTATAGPELDEHLRGAKAGDILKFNAVPVDEAGTGGPEAADATFQVLVKEVREKILPAADDEWASEASEFETIVELRQNVRDQMESVRKLQAALTVRDKLLAALGELVTEDVPGALVMGEMERRVRLLSHQLSHRGIELTQYLEVRGLTQDGLLDELRVEAAEAVKVDLALGEVAKREGIEVSDAEVDEEVARMASQTNRAPAVVRRKLESEESMPAVRSGLRKTKAVEWLLAHCQLVDEEGHVIAREGFLGSTEPEEVLDSVSGGPSEAPGAPE